VLVVGLLPTQAGRIQQGLGEYLDMRFWKDDNTDTLRQLAKMADVVFIPGTCRIRSARWCRRTPRLRGSRMWAAG